VRANIKSTQAEETIEGLTLEEMPIAILRALGKRQELNITMYSVPYPSVCDGGVPFAGAGSG